MSAERASGSSAFDPDSLQSRISTELPREGPWLRRCARTFMGVLGSPRVLFSRCPEPVDHGAALRFLATLRLVPWVGLVLWLGSEWLMMPERELQPSRGIHALVDPSLAEALSVWMLLMVPVGMPLLYFLSGLVSHIAVGLTGGASRSVGASMRAVGYAMGPALLGIGLLDVATFTVGMPGEVYPWIVIGLLLIFLRGAALGLAQTHHIHLVRALLVAFVPALLLLVAFTGRAVLQLDDTPGVPEPPSPYVVP